VTATRGNHGQSLAGPRAARRCRCTVYVPEGNSPEKNDAMTARRRAA
jgi:threonine dehydratase